MDHHHETLDRHDQEVVGKSSHDHEVASHEPAVRSRWTPKPEQILILESIFNSGMVNPPKEETVRIRKLLEKFGAVGDANVFYWFQNRRSRSRRRQRQQQMQHAATLLHHHQMAATTTAGMPNSSDVSSSSSFLFQTPPPPPPPLAPSPEIIFDAQSPSSSLFYPPPPPPPADHHHMHLLFQSAGYISVFINGVPTEVPKGPIEVKAMFGEDVVLVHSSGLPLPTNDFGVLLQALHPGESYFLVPRQTLCNN